MVASLFFKNLSNIDNLIMLKHIKGSFPISTRSWILDRHAAFKINHSRTKTTYTKNSHINKHPHRTYLDQKSNKHQYHVETKIMRMDKFQQETTA